MKKLLLALFTALFAGLLGRNRSIGNDRRSNVVLPWSVPLAEMAEIYADLSGCFCSGYYMARVTLQIKQKER
jgi:hypothetical protein